MAKADMERAYRIVCSTVGKLIIENEQLRTELERLRERDARLTAELWGEDSPDGDRPGH